MNYITKQSAALWMRGLAGALSKAKPGLANGLKRTGDALKHQKANKLSGEFSRATLRSLPLATRMGLAASVLKNLSPAQLGSLGQKFQARFGHLPDTLKKLIDKQMQTASSIGKKVNESVTKNNLFSAPQKKAVIQASQDALQSYTDAAPLFHGVK